MTEEESQLFKILDDQTNGHQRGVFARLRGYFLAGILVTAPISITIYLTYIFVRFVDDRVSLIIPAHYNPNNFLPFSVPGLGLVIAVVFFILVGWFTRNFLGRLLIRLSEYIVHRVPIINTLYKAVKQVFETIMGSQSQAFRDVVMFEYPRKGIWCMGFVTGVTKGEVQRLTDSEVVNVFLPTTPNPTSGFLLFVPRKDLNFLEMTVDEAIKMVISGGIITPPDVLDKKEPTQKKAGKGLPFGGKKNKAPADDNGQDAS